MFSSGQILFNESDSFNIELYQIEKPKRELNFYSWSYIKKMDKCTNTSVKPEERSVFRQHFGQQYRSSGNKTRCSLGLSK